MEGTQRPRRPWSTLDQSLGPLLVPVLPKTIAAAIDAIEAEVPGYRGSMAGPMGPVLLRGVETAFRRLLALLGSDEDALNESAAGVYRRIGAGERAAGRTLEALLGAYRTGARVAWEEMSAAATAGGIETQDLVSLAEAIFVYIDELSAVTVAGYVSEQAAEAGYRDVVRRRLAEALVDGVAATDLEAVRRLADEAGWIFPAKLAVAVVPGAAGSGRPLPTAPADVLVLERGVEVIAVVPDPSGPGRRAAFVAAAPTTGVYVGTVRAPTEAAVSLAHARRLHRLVIDGVVAAEPVVVANDHLAEMVVAADPALLAELAERYLRPLDALPPERRRTLEVTLSAWLGHDGDRLAVAAALVVHPQTVSYRMSQIRRELGPFLASPRDRMALRLALLGRGVHLD